MNAKQKRWCVFGAVLGTLAAALLLPSGRGPEGDSRSRASVPATGSTLPAAHPVLAQPVEAPQQTEPVLTSTRERRSEDVEAALAELEAQTTTLSAAEQARLLRLPVISAIRSSQPDGEVRHRAMRDALAGSGPSDEPWTRSAREVFESWERALPPDDARSVDLGAVRCFAAGCEVLVTFSDRESSERAASSFRGLREPAGRHGGRVQTPPLSLGDERVQVSWMLLRPDVALP